MSKYHKAHLRVRLMMKFHWKPLLNRKFLNLSLSLSLRFKNRQAYETPASALSGKTPPNPEGTSLPANIIVLVLSAIRTLAVQVSEKRYSDILKSP